MKLKKASISILALLVINSASGASTPTFVNSDNFTRAESDLYFFNVSKKYGLGKIGSEREMAPIDNQTIIRLNRDTLYSGGVFDLDAGPVDITLPDSQERFMSAQVIDENHYTHTVHYGGGKISLNKEKIGTRYAFVGIRILANPNDKNDMEEVHLLQKKIKVTQKSIGTLDIPKWDKLSQDKTRKALLQLAELLPDTDKMFGSRSEVDPIRHLIGSAMGWGGNPSRDALYLNRNEDINDGSAIYRLNISDVPVKGFWSITVYNQEGYIVPNQFNSYTVNNLTAVHDAKGNVTVQFGGCDGKIPNCIPITKNWNWMVRLYRPSAEIMTGKWIFPNAERVK